jgi:hypothetical protein
MIKLQISYKDKEVTIPCAEDDVVWDVCQQNIPELNVSE